MEIKCMVNCNGIGYENFKAGEIRSVSEDTAEKLIDFGYAELLMEEEDSGKKESSNKRSKNKKKAAEGVADNPSKNIDAVKSEEEETNATEE